MSSDQSPLSGHSIPPTVCEPQRFRLDPASACNNSWPVVACRPSESPGDARHVYKVQQTGIFNETASSSSSSSSSSSFSPLPLLLPHPYRVAPLHHIIFRAAAAVAPPPPHRPPPRFSP